jgi:hypothetical protein
MHVTDLVLPLLALDQFEEVFTSAASILIARQLPMRSSKNWPDLRSAVRPPS